MEALDYFNGKQQEHSRKVKNTLVEYVLIANINDSEEVSKKPVSHALKLALAVI